MDKNLPRHLDLTQLHTRELLQYLQSARACGGTYNPGDHDYGGIFFTILEIKAELAKREHIPNKQEGIAARRLKARTTTRTRNLRPHGKRIGK